jgi:hypothetical protein
MPPCQVVTTYGVAQSRGNRKSSNKQIEMKPGTGSRHLRDRNRKPYVPSKKQAFGSNGTEVRVRGNARQLLEKYLTLARDAQAAGERIAAENYSQHAEHYFRIINANAEGNSRSRHHQPPEGTLSPNRQLPPRHGRSRTALATCLGALTLKTGMKANPAPPRGGLFSRVSARHACNPGPTKRTGVDGARMTVAATYVLTRAEKNTSRWLALTTT